MKKDLLAMLLLVDILVTISRAETFVYTDPQFPYKITCRQEWVEVTKDDSTFEMKKKGTGKVPHMLVKKYVIDTSFDITTNEWSRWSFAVNEEYAGKIGKIGRIDSSSTKKIGALRAFEIYSYYNLEVDGKPVRWAQYDRWAELNRTGFLVSVIADSVDMTTNFSSYKSMLDSMNLQAAVDCYQKNDFRQIDRPLSNHFDGQPLHFSDLLGRANETTAFKASVQMVTKKARFLLVR
jgi:hypothetical protein